MYQEEEPTMWPSNYKWKYMTQKIVNGIDINIYNDSDMHVGWLKVVCTFMEVFDKLKLRFRIRITQRSHRFIM
jgi:hypothetical protein